MISGCSEATFLVNSAKRIGTWGDEPTYKVGNPYKLMENGIILQLTMITMKLAMHRGMGQVFTERKRLMVKFLIKIKFQPLIEPYHCPRLLKSLI